MPSKAYSKEDREVVGQQLLETALSLYSKHGIQHVRLADILKIVGISKPFFYTFYQSVQEFVVQVLDFQWLRITELIEEIEGTGGRAWQDRARDLLHRFAHYRQHGLLVMTQEEEIWVRQRLDDACYHTFMVRQVSFFEEILRLWGIPSERCEGRVFANMVLSMIVIHSSAQKALPFFYLDVLEATAHTQIEAMIAYLETLHP